MSVDLGNAINLSDFLFRPFVAFEKAIGTIRIQSCVNVMGLRGVFTVE